MATIQLRTSIPGPQSQAWMRRREAAVPRGAYHTTPIFVARAEGALLEDVDGNRFVDFAGGLGCLNTGHRAPHVVAGLRAQLHRYLHTCFHVTPYDGYVRLAERLNALTPGKFAKKTLLVNSGAEAVENSIKIARAFTRRPAVICFEDGFHGRTLLTLSLTTKTHPYKSGFEPFVGDVYRIPYAYCYRCAYSLEYPGCKVACAHHLEDAFKRVAAAESVAAVIAEPVLGEGGFVAPPPEFFSILQDICRRHGILFIADEVQTGLGRTGSLFASTQFGIEPDLLVAAKSLGGGLALASVTGRAAIMDAPAVGALGGTFGGNPLACEAALAALAMFDPQAPGDGAHDHLDLLARANYLGERFKARGLEWQRRWPLIGDVRGVGAMRALELVRPPSREPADDETAQVVRYCYEHGLIVLSAGSYGNVIRLLVPLVITDEQFEEGLAVLEGALASVGAPRSSQASSAG
ncbi:MAG TPA: 4-aminobutyrate--2-oxoglutarate transaminase [Terriglobia bacterium]|nr:4-aminobutyrate--2-oxoglutarate transaminase [Terriglobia bacterium]